jgi:two-component system sensor histidine kinase ChvG
VNLVVLLVPVAGLELARLYERRLLGALERDMRNQAALVRAMIEDDLARGIALGTERQEIILTRAARHTRMRVRILDARGDVAADSHAHGPPEGEEPVVSGLIGLTSTLDGGTSVSGRERRARDTPTWAGVRDRPEVVDALDGAPSSRTRLRARAPAVLLFITEPIRRAGEVAGVVYVTRSTTPVLLDLHRIRTGLTKVLAVALVFTLALTLLLAWTISRPLARLADAARRIARGERDVPVPVRGSGEIRDLAESFAAMTEKLDARTRYIAEFAADVAHEFKSPLTSIRGAAELLESGAADDPEARARFLRNIELDTERLDRLVSRLLQLSRLETSAEPMSTVDLDAVLHRSVERIATDAQPVELRWDARSRLVRGRATDLEVAFLNVLDNAIRFSPPTVPVTVTATGGAEAPIVVSVRDRGPGVPEAVRHRVFDRFFTTDAERSGTGLGLAIVKTVLHAHGGSVVLEPTEGEGAEVRMTLPPA